MKFSNSLLAGMFGLSMLLVAGAANAGQSGLVLDGSGPFDLKFTGFTAPSADGGADKIDSGIESTFGGGYISAITQAGNAANPFWSSGENGQTISYMLYGIADYRETTGTNGYNLYNYGCTVGPDCDGKIHLNFYLNNTVNMPGFSGPNGISTSDRVGNTLGALTAGTLLMSWVLVPGIVDVPGDPNGVNENTTLFQNVSALTLPAEGDGDFLADCVAGPGCADLVKGTQTNGADLSGEFTLFNNANGAEASNGWLGRTEDPVNGVAVDAPEPASLALLGLGLAMLTALRRRKS